MCDFKMGSKILIIALFHALFVFTPILGCSLDDWTTSFDTKGYSTCKRSSKYMNGLERSENGGNEDGINLLEKAQCCPRTAPFFNMPTNCIAADWAGSLNQNNRWSNCPQGFFLQGLYRSDGKWLDNIEYGKCCKPANHPYFYGRCYEQDVSSSFDNNGLSKCDEGYFMIGLYRGTCNKLNCLEKFKCCQMYPNAPELESLDDVKTRVMDVTLNDLVYLAHYLGYGWCAGCRGEYVGEDFRRSGDSWEADKKGPCEGYKSDQRLKLHYKNFGFGITDIKYGTPVIQSMTPEVQLSGKVSNPDSTPLTQSVERVVTSTRTVTHSTTSAWKVSQELGIEISYTPPPTGGVGGKVAYKFGYESSQTTTDSTSNQQQNKISIKSQKTLEPKSAAKYKIIVTKTRTTMPYTATVIAKFSAELDGFLRWGGGKDGDSTNYHYQHRGSGDRPTFKYSFGDGKIPFYTALKRESERDPRPWQWNDMKSRWENAQSVIDTLTSEGFYEFRLNGQFEDVIGEYAEIEWDTASLSGDALSDDNATDEKAPDPPRVFPDPPKVNITIPAAKTQKEKIQGD